MKNLAEQVLKLADEGHVLELASAVVINEQSRLICYGERRAQWLPSRGYRFPLNLAFTEIEIGSQPKKAPRRIAAMISMAEFLVEDSDGEGAQGVTVNESNQAAIANDAWSMEIVEAFATAYAAAPDVQATQPVDVWPVMQDQFDVLGAEVTTPAITDRRRVKLCDSYFPDPEIRCA